MQACSRDLGTSVGVTACHVWSRPESLLFNSPERMRTSLVCSGFDFRLYGRYGCARPRSAAGHSMRQPVGCARVRKPETNPVDADDSQTHLFMCEVGPDHDVRILVHCLPP